MATSSRATVSRQEREFRDRIKELRKQARAGDPYAWWVAAPATKVLRPASRRVGRGAYTLV